MYERSDFPFQVTTIDNTFITLRDGIRLSARMWLPQTDEPVPAILEYIPYRKDDMTAWRDSLRHPYLAGHGYACVRVDIRGNGHSDGLMLDEYLQQELDDGYELIEWLAAQNWCDGNVGMFGKSWGGFNALQVAAMRPPALKAIITVCSTDDRYADDVHYMGGAMLASEMLPWASTMLCYNATPPDPNIVGERWREMWLDRLENTPPFVDEWLSHQRRDAFWQHGSICENYADIECAVYAVGGWADGYTNAILRMLENLSGSRKGLIGPWAHNYPTNSNPQPSIGFMQESLRWWDQWLKGEETGIMDEPMLRSWIQDSWEPSALRPEAPGRWVADTSWPPPTRSEQTIEFAEPDMKQATIIGSPYAGMASPQWLGFGNSADYPIDQRSEDGLSLSWTSEPQPTVNLLGQPAFHFKLSVDQPVASLALRLCDVAPSGASTLVSWGLHNLNHRKNHLEPEALPVDEPFDVSILLNDCGHSLAEGHRWRVAVSPTYFPHLWPAPTTVALTVHTCKLTLPVRKPSTDDALLADFGRVETAPQMLRERLRDGTQGRQVIEDREAGTLTYIRTDDSGKVRFPNGLIYDDAAEDTYTINVESGAAEISCKRSRTLQHEGWNILITTQSRMTSDAHNFYVENHVQAFDDAKPFFDKTYTKTIVRDFN